MITQNFAPPHIFLHVASKYMSWTILITCQNECAHLYSYRKLLLLLDSRRKIPCYWSRSMQKSLPPDPADAINPRDRCSAKHFIGATGPGPAASRAARAGGHHVCMCRRQSRGHLLLPTPVGSVSTAAGGWLVLKCLLPAPAHALARAASGWLVLNCLLPAPAHAE